MHQNPAVESLVHTQGERRDTGSWYAEDRHVGFRVGLCMATQDHVGNQPLSALPSP